MAVVVMAAEGRATAGRKAIHSGEINTPAQAVAAAAVLRVAAVAVDHLPTTMKIVAAVAVEEVRKAADAVVILKAAIIGPTNLAKAK